MTRSVLSRLSPPRSLMSSTERPVPMPRVSTSTLTTTTTSTTTCSTTSSTTSTTTSTCSSSRSPLTSPSLHISNHSQALPTTLVPARQIISSEIGFFSKSQEESGVANDFDIESIDQIEIENHVGENEVFTLQPETVAPAPKPAKRQRRKEPSSEVRVRTKPRLDQSWRESYITTKKKVGRLQPNHGKRPNFFYAIENN